MAFCANTNYDPSSFKNSPHIEAKPNTPVPITNTPKSEQYQLGKKLFKMHCNACHNKNMIDKMVGPALAGTQERWEGREALLYQWIRNASAVIASGDPYAVQLYNEYNQSVMPSYPNFTDKEIEAILEYIAKQEK